VAGNGPPPKDPAKRRRRNAAPVPTTVVAEDGQIRGPDLPDGFPWPPQTLRWWRTWRTSPQAQTLTTTDWDFLIDTAVIHAAFWHGDTSVAGELRLRVAKFGATPEDRMRLRMQIDEPTKLAGGEQEEQKAGDRYGHLRSVKTG
jgi:hypothetical protein